MGMRFLNHVIQSRFRSQRGTKRDTATAAFIFLMFKQDSPLPQTEGNLITPHLLDLMHVAVRPRFQGAQTHTYVHIHTNKIRMLRSKIVCSASLTYGYGATAQGLQPRCTTGTGSAQFAHMLSSVKLQLSVYSCSKCGA